MENIYIGENEWNSIFYLYTRTDNFSEFNSLFSNSYSKEKIIDYNDWILIWQSMVRVNFELAYEGFLYIGNNMSISNFVTYTPKNKVDYHQALRHKALKICVLAENPDNLVSIKNLK